VREAGVMTNLHTDFFTNLDRLRLPSQAAEVPPTCPMPPPVPPRSKRIKGEFLKGPIPLNWLTAASKLRGKAPLTVALAVWFQVGRRKSRAVTLTSAVVERFGVNRKAKYAGLAALEKASLVRVHRRPRKNPIVTVLDLPDDDKDHAEDDAE